MKTVDVRIGATYLCRVGERLVEVVVTERHPGAMRNSGRRSPDMFTVHRVGEQKYLPKLRTAAALRPILEASTPEATRPSAIAAGREAYEKAVAQGRNPLEAENAAIKAYNETSNETARHATPISQEFYLSAAENKVGWCANCQAFRGTDIEADSRELECPDCHKHTLYGAELALRTWLIAPIEDDTPSKPFWRCESCGHENHERAMPPDRQAFYAGNRPKWLTVCPRCKSDDFTPVGY